MEQPDKIGEARKLLLEGGRGRFELLPTVFSPSELMGHRPVVLVRQVCFRLGVGEGDFKAKSFRRWLERYRKGNTEQAMKMPVAGGKPTAFSFTDPATIKKEDSIIKIL